MCNAWKPAMTSMQCGDVTPAVGADRRATGVTAGRRWLWPNQTAREAMAMMSVKGLAPLYRNSHDLPWIPFTPYSANVKLGSSG
jgi:hypothetical protein